jgi:hypothetical protein
MASETGTVAGMVQLGRCRWVGSQDRR